MAFILFILEMESCVSCSVVRCAIAVFSLSLDFFGAGSEPLDCWELEGFCRLGGPPFL